MILHIINLIKREKSSTSAGSRPQLLPGLMKWQSRISSSSSPEPSCLGKTESLCVLTIGLSYVVFVMTSHEMDLEHMKKEAGTHFRKNAHLVRNLIVLDL